MNKKLNTLIIICITCSSIKSFTQKQTIQPDLLNKSNFNVVNRQQTVNVNEEQRPIVHLNVIPNYGGAWVNDVNFSTGIIELDIKGKNLIQQSFVGIAFHGLNDSTFEVIYFRPFNFQSPDTLRRKWAVQYMSVPDFDYDRLRKEHPLVYENAVTPVPRPENWFHASIIVVDEYVTVYVNHSTTASRKVKLLNNPGNRRIGLWSYIPGVRRRFCKSYTDRISKSRGV